MLGMRRIFSSATLLGLLVAAAACEEPQKPKAEPAKSAAPAPTPAASEALEPKPETKPAAARKKAEDCPSGPKVTFDDKAFEDAVRLKLPKPTGDITKSDLGRLKSLNLSSLKFDQLDPCLFPEMSGLKELFLGPGDYDDLSPLKNSTKLESLRASISHVRDIKVLADMTKLDRLDLGRTQVADLAPLSGITSLTELQLDDTPVEDLSPLAKLTKLERLSIQRTRVKDVAALKGIKSLKFLYVTGSPVEEEPAKLAPIKANGTKVMGP